MNLENVLHTQNMFFRRLENFFDKEKDFFPFQNCIFFDFHRLHGTSNFHLKQFETIKNLSQLTSTPIKVEPSVVRACWLFLWIAVILKKCASITIIQWRQIKKISDESKANTWPNSGTFWGCWDFVKVWESQNRRRSTLNRVEISHSSRLRQ